MATQGAFSIVLSGERTKILLIRRKDFPIWDLPGGRVEKQESVEKCAIREAYEETGYDIKVTEKISVYIRSALDDTQHVFAGEISGGQEITEGNETNRIEWFSLSRLPLLMIPHRKGQIKDFQKGDYGIEKKLKDSRVLMKVMKALKKR